MTHANKSTPSKHFSAFIYLWIKIVDMKKGANNFIHFLKIQTEKQRLIFSKKTVFGNSIIFNNSNWRTVNFPDIFTKKKIEIHSFLKIQTENLTVNFPVIFTKKNILKCIHLSKFKLKNKRLIFQLFSRKKNMLNKKAHIFSTSLHYSTNILEKVINLKWIFLVLPLVFYNFYINFWLLLLQ